MSIGPGIIAPPERCWILGSPIDSVDIPETIARIERWISERDGTHCVSVSNVSTIVEGHRDPEFRKITSSADLSVPDGMPLVWVARFLGLENTRRCAGPDLFLEFMNLTRNRDYRHYFYGSRPEVVEQLARVVENEFGATVVGFYSPPFRHLTAKEDEQIVRAINAARPDVLWVGLGCPKQERWMFAHRARIRVPAMLGVGQVFDIYAGALKRAPRWMQAIGLEWLFRLAAEPRRLWRRYLIFNSVFVYRLLCDCLSRRTPAMESGPFERSNP